MFATTLVAILLVAAPEKPKLAVLELTAGGGIAPEVAKGFTQAVSGELSKRAFFSVVTSEDVQTLLGMERQRALLGCSEQGGSCLAELAGALGARFVLSGSLTRIGDAYQLYLQTLDTTTTQPLGRSTVLGNDLDVLRRQIPLAVAEATRTPLPPAPSHLLPYSLIGLGGAAAVLGMVGGQDAFARTRQVKTELAQSSAGAPTPRTYEEYRQELTSVGQEQTVAVILLGAGAALIGTGTFLLVREPTSGGHLEVALVPIGRGVGLAGAWP